MIPRLAARRTGRWLDDRLRLTSVTRTAIAKIFPDHWSFMLGEIAMYSFIVLLLTGTYLTLFFEPTTAERLYRGSYAPLAGSHVSGAYASTVELSYDVRAGLLIRQTHHWAALVFLAAAVTHLCRIFFTAAFRKPRELNWLVGVTMLVLGIFNGFAGYSLPDDLLSGTGLRIASAVVLSIPVVGPWLQFLLFGGEFPGHELEQRLYIAHVLIVPAVIVLLLTVHMAVLIRQKHTHFGGPGRRDTNVVGSRMWPTYAFRSMSLLSAVAAVCFALGGLVQINPIWLWGPFSPSAVTSPAQPDWYIGWVEGSLRLFPAWEFRIAGHLVPNVFWSAVVIPGVIFLVIYLWPWIDKRMTHDRSEHHVLQNPRAQPLRVAIGVYGLTLVGVLLVAGGNDVFARLLHIPLLTVIYVMRTVVIVLPFLAAAIAYAITRALLRSHAEALSDMPAKALVSDVDLREEESEPPPEPEPPFVLLRRRPLDVPPESELHHATPGDAPGDEL